MGTHHRLVVILTAALTCALVGAGLPGAPGAQAAATADTGDEKTEGDVYQSAPTELPKWVLPALVLPALKDTDSAPLTRLLVSLNVKIEPEGTLTPDKVAAQRKRIAKAAETFLAELPKGEFKVAYVSRFVPVVAVDVTKAARSVIDGSKLVASARPSRILRQTQQQQFDAVGHVGGHPAHRAGFDGAGSNVAFVDSGVDRDHPDLRDKVVAEACFGADHMFFNGDFRFNDQVVDMPTSCPGGEDLETHGPGAAAPCWRNAVWQPDNIEMNIPVEWLLGDACGHGTSTSSIAAGHRGVAPGAGVIMAQASTLSCVGGILGIECEPIFEEPELLKAIEWIFDQRNEHEIAALNMSMGSIVEELEGVAEVDERGFCEVDSPLVGALAQLRSVGIAVVAGSGNDGVADSIYYPACLPGVVAVGATTPEDAVADFSNSAPSLDLLAPGVDVETALPAPVPLVRPPLPPRPPGGHRRVEGTSVAAPMVSGAWAVLDQVEPEASVSQIQATLTQSGRPVLDRRNNLRRPRLDLWAALTRVLLRRASHFDFVGGNNTSRSPSVSTDGSLRVAFASRATNLVPGGRDRNGTWDVFVHSAQDNRTWRVSIASNGAEANGWSDSPSISGEGRYVAFESEATNLVANGDDRNGVRDVFVRDTVRNTTERVSVATDGTERNAESLWPSISGNGRYVAFVSSATLVDDDRNGSPDIYVHDRTTRRTERVSIASDGTEAAWSPSTAPSISADGRHVAFQSLAPNLVPEDNNWTSDIFVHDRDTHATERVSVGPDGAEADDRSYQPSISADGGHVAFTSVATNLEPGGDRNRVEDVFVHDRTTHTTTRVSINTNRAEGNGDSEAPSISADGRHVTFASMASNLVGADANRTWDVFVHDQSTRTTKRVSVTAAGDEANSSTHGPDISDDGRWIAFHGDAANLLADDRNGVADVFVRRRP